VLPGGALDIHGAKTTPSWTLLDGNVARGSTTITLAEPVNWKVGAEVCDSPLSPPLLLIYTNSQQPCLGSLFSPLPISKISSLIRTIVKLKPKLERSKGKKQ
jgi:hypothetical protein